LERQRLDKWLWHARVVKARTSAAALVEAGHVRINGVREKAPGHAVKLGDVLTIGLAREVATEGIRVNSVRPGIIRTDIHASGGEPGRVDRLGPTVPMHRGGEAIEVARAILWLLSDEASYSTGAILDVSGGR